MTCTPCQKKKVLDHQLCERCEKQKRKYIVKDTTMNNISICNECLLYEDKIMATIRYD